uniref:Uncharacterized protein n=1 Tax=Klebsiella pneumoniae TaxID=573 RepID=A0A7L7TNA0_KLEPN|nr:hypothetical protein [Klebsiella pneumoniae]
MNFRAIADSSNVENVVLISGVPAAAADTLPPAI